MNNEIKEILDKLQKVANRETASRNALMEMKDTDYQLLLDYITNLQKENDYYFKKNNELSSLNTSLRNDRDNYKSRIDKAIEYNYELQERYCHSAIRDELIASKIYEITEKELNILQGENKE